MSAVVKNGTVALCAFLSLMLQSEAFAGGLKSSTNDLCDAWFGKYVGRVPADENFSGEDENAWVTIDKKEGMLVQVGNINGGAIEASSRKFHCSKDEVRSTLDSGWGGHGKVAIHRKQNNMYLRVYDFVEGNGPSEAIHLPFESTEIEIKLR